jgi:sialate O-acetylesterase
VPVGLINTTWGGTVAEAWTSAGALSKMGDFDRAIRSVDTISQNIGQFMAEDRRNDEIWQVALGKTNDECTNPAFNDESWKVMILPTAWENAGYPDLDGIVWFRKTIDVPENWAGKNLKLDLGPIDDYDITYFNGVQVGQTSKDGSWFIARHYEIPAALVKAGRNVIVVRVTDLQGNGGIYGEKELLKVYPANGSPEQGISLAGEWRFAIKAVKPRAALANNPNTVTVLYNGMIAPLIPFAIRGAIWYQGEANVDRAAQYEKLFPVMIGDWRSQWKEGDFPFYFVQIAPFKYGGDSTRAAALRDAQRKTLGLSNTGMAVTLDIGDTGNIHPANKEEVGRRLALWALSGTYGEKGIVYSGPLYKSMRVRDGAVEVSFTHADGGLTSQGQELSGFEIAGADGRFVRAKAAIHGDKVRVQSDAVAYPVAVRYDWYATAQASLFNGSGLPASSFSSAP